MAQHNIVTLTGNIGAEARIIATSENTFVALSLATTDSYKDETGQWQNKETIWHNVLAFNPRLIEQLKSFKTGTRLTITGSLSYRPFDVVNGDGQRITKQEASIIANRVEMAPLAKKSHKVADSA